MSVDERLAEQARHAADQITARQHDLDTARAEFVRAVRALYLGGGSLREIAEVLGLSHQRVHQLLDLPRHTATARPRRRGYARAITCSFCEREQSQVRKLITGQDGAGICNDCVSLATTAAAHHGPATDPRTTISPPADGTGRCSFCGKRPGEGADPVTLVTPEEASTAVCTECLDLCHTILAEQPA